MKFLITSILLTTLLSSCALFTKSKDKRTYYAFRSSPASTIANKPSLEAHVRSVSIPGYLDRTELVARTTANEVEVLDRFLWAESLDKEVARTVAANLRQLLGTSQIVALDSELAPRSTGLKIDIEVTRFELDQNGNVIFEGLYLVDDRDGDEKSRNQSFRFTTPAVIPIDEEKEAGKGRETIAVAAMNVCLDQLSLDIARTLAKRG